MQLQRLLVILGAFSTLLVCSRSSSKVTFKDGVSEDKIENQENFTEVSSQQRIFNPIRHIENLFDLIGFETRRNVDPYLARVNEGCLTGDLAECFKFQAFNYFSNFFDHPEYSVSDYVRIKRMSDRVVKKVYHEPYEYSGESRSGESEWDRLLNFMKRKTERFVKTMSFELTVPVSEIGYDGAYEPRFLDEIADEINTLEDKKDTLFSRYQFRKLLIPMLLVLKLFKLKLLLFLPLIFGLASFKKFLGFLAIAIPGLIGFFKLYKPLMQSYYQPVYTKNGIGHPNYGVNVHPDTDYHEAYYGNVGPYAQDLAYRGYQHYES